MLNFLKSSNFVRKIKLVKSASNFIKIGSMGFSKIEIVRKSKFIL